MSVKVPHHKPPPAAPEINRPMMKAIEFGAEALTADPISKIAIDARYTVLTGKMVHSCPKAGWKDISVKK